MKQAIVRYETTVPEGLRNSDIHPLLQRVYANRNITSSDDVNYNLNQLLDYTSLKGIDKAVEVIADAMTNNKTIVIIGDYDADGATSTALMVKSFKLFGHENVHFLVPNRFEYGYGLTAEIVEVANKLKPDLIITVDNGISSIEGVNQAKKYGIKVVITDHHLAGNTLPDADAIVNPNQPGCLFPSKCIAGVGVAFYTMLALRSHLRENGWFAAANDVPNMAMLLDLVALGTVADVVALDKNNRILIEHGLQRIRCGRAISCILELLEVTGRNISNCTSLDLAFYVAPRLNAAGRLEDMSEGIECLLSENIEHTQAIVHRLHALNAQRKDIEKDMLDTAYEILNTELDYKDKKSIPAGLCIYNASWHQGVIGLLASRVKEKYYRPVIAFADAGDNEIKGSGRSIQGLHIRDVLDTIATANPGLVKKFGGHAMAAGLSLDRDDFEKFSEKYLEEVEKQLSSDDLNKVILSDGTVPIEFMSLHVAEIIRLAGPWGQRFQEPVFDDRFEVINWKIIGSNHLKMQLKSSVNNSSELIDAIAFNQDETSLPQAGSSIRASYRMSVNEFRNNKSLQLIIDCIEAA